MKYTKVEDAVKKLEELSDLENTEIGEAWRKLIYSYGYNYCFSDKFNKAVEKEIIEQANQANEDFEIAEETVKESSYKQTVLRRKQ